ncbi:nitrate- and nitrite sensing domain-containing protein, partial [Streptomyces sp. NPDC049577]|uniref:nitrate- and nitrite sensing domain-containing protein n=1 Tax=Streptomyces sp. NPDC049577 TaxID=3155153 RepID=UPI00342D7CDC
MRKKRLRGGRREQQTTAVPERTARVRTRLVASVALVSLTVLGASAFGIADALRDLTESRHLADLGRTDAAAAALAHSLADERDTVTEYVAGGRGNGPAAAIPEDRRDRVDGQIERFRGIAPPSVLRRLDAFPDVRRRALEGPGDALAVHTAYSTTVQALTGTTGDLAHRLPSRAGADAAAGLPALARAADQASATRGLPEAVGRCPVPSPARRSWTGPRSATPWSAS